MKIPVIENIGHQRKLYEISQDLERAGLAKVRADQVPGAYLWTVQFIFKTDTGEHERIRTPQMVEAMKE